MKLPGRFEWKILAAVQCGHGPARMLVKNREMKLVDMEVQHVELRRHLPHLVEHEHVVRNDVTDFSVQPQCCRNAAH